MDVFEIERKETLSRSEVATRLRHLANMLEKDDVIEFEDVGMKMKVHVPDEVEVKVELEVESDDLELELELKW